METETGSGVTRFEIVRFLNIVSYVHLNCRPHARFDLRKPIKNDVHALISLVKLTRGRNVALILSDSRFRAFCFPEPIFSFSITAFFQSVG